MFAKTLVFIYLFTHYLITPDVTFNLFRSNWEANESKVRYDELFARKLRRYRFHVLKRNFNRIIISSVCIILFL